MERSLSGGFLQRFGTEGPGIWFFLPTASSEGTVICKGGGHSGSLQSGACKSTIWSAQRAQEHGWSAPEGEPLAISLTKDRRRTDEMEASKDRQTDDGTQMSPRKLQEECGKLKRREEEGNEMKPGEQIRNRITTK